MKKELKEKQLHTKLAEIWVQSEAKPNVAMPKAYELAKSEDADRIKQLEAALKLCVQFVPETEWLIKEGAKNILTPPNGL